MTRLVWGETGTRNFEAGVDRGVLYPPSSSVGVPWNGLTSVNERPLGGDSSPYYHDGVKYMQIARAEEFEATIEAYSAPSEFASCDGTSAIYLGLYLTQQPRKQFGFSYRTLIGNDLDSTSHGYKIHIVYNALAKPSSRANYTISNSPDAMSLSWDITTVPIAITGFKPTSHIVISSLVATSAHLIAVENILYGTSGVSPKLITVAELIAIFSS